VAARDSRAAAGQAACRVHPGGNPAQRSIPRGIRARDARPRLCRKARGLTPPELVITTFSIHLRNNLVGDGRFITALPESVLRIYRKRHALKELPIELSVRPPVAAVTLRNRTLGPTVQLFLECAREVAKRGEGLTLCWQYGLSTARGAPSAPVAAPTWSSPARKASALPCACRKGDSHCRQRASRLAWLRPRRNVSGCASNIMMAAAEK
jgi:hypothetical protein